MIAHDDEGGPVRGCVDPAQNPDGRRSATSHNILAGAFEYLRRKRPNWHQSEALQFLKENRTDTLALNAFNYGKGVAMKLDAPHDRT